MEQSRIVVKFGSGILASKRGVGLDEKQIARLARELAALVKSGREVILVSSGAVAAGLGAMGLAARPADLAGKQACAAVGQSRLMSAYTAHFARHGLTVAQVLLTHADLDSRIAYTNIRATLQRLLASGIIPIINENDTVAVEELNLGDNDRLSAEVAVLMRASLLVLLTSVDGLLDKKGALVPRVDAVEKAQALVKKEKTPQGTGGMGSKLDAAALATAAGIPVVIASGRKPGRIATAAAGKPVGTFFPAPQK